MHLIKRLIELRPYTGCLEIKNNLKKMINKEYLFVFLVFSFLHSLNAQEGISGMENNFKMECNLRPEKNAKEYILTITFTEIKQSDYKLIWNDSHCFSFKKSLSVYDNNSDESRKEKFSSYLKSLPISQIIIENENGDMECLSYNMHNPRTIHKEEKMVLHSQLSMPEPINNLLSFDFVDSVSFTYRIKSESLILEKKDKRIRLNYFYIPFNEKYDTPPFVLTSNWVDIPLHP